MRPNEWWGFNTSGWLGFKQMDGGDLAKIHGWEFAKCHTLGQVKILHIY